MSESLPDVSEIDAALRARTIAVGASELHGSLSGWIAGGGATDAGWLVEVLVDDTLPRLGEDDVLERLRRVTEVQLEDRSFGFALVIPGEDASLAERSGALFDWCRGFVGAFGLAAGSAPPLSEESSEALVDLVKLSRATAQEDGDQDDEDALAEIEEFIRVAALLLHGDCAMGPRHRGRMN